MKRLVHIAISRTGCYLAAKQSEEIGWLSRGMQVCNGMHNRARPDLCGGPWEKPVSLPRCLWPTYHSKDERIEGHLFITVLAYHAAHLVPTKLKTHDIHDSWNTLRTRLNRIKRITTRIPKTKHRYLITNVDEDLMPFLERVVQCLGLNYDFKATKPWRSMSSNRVPQSLKNRQSHDAGAVVHEG